MSHQKCIFLMTEDTSLITKEATDKGILNVINDIEKRKKILMMHLHTKIQTIHPM